MSLPLTLALIAGTGIALRWLASRIGLPVAVGYLLGGMILGPLGIGIITRVHLDELVPVTTVVSSFILFMVGRELDVAKIKSEGSAPALTALAESMTTFIAVSIAAYLVTDSPAISLILGVTAIPTAPATVAMILHQYTPRGPLTKLIRSTVALDDVVATAVGAAVMAITGWTILGGNGHANLGLLNVIPVLAAGGLAGAFLSIALRRFRGYGHRSGLIIGTVLSLLALWNISYLAPPMAALVAGGVLVNRLRYSRAFWHKFEEFLDLIYLMFFVYLGAHVEPSLVLGAPALVGAYIVARLLGKGLGATLGCACSRLSPTMGTYVGMALMPQGTLSIILAAMAERFSPLAPGLLLNIVLASTLAFEILGPFGITLALGHYHETHDINRRFRVRP